MFQLPSFLKIRMVALVIGFFILFWLIGFTKWAFAVDAGCIFVKYNERPDISAQASYYPHWKVWHCDGTSTQSTTNTWYAFKAQQTVTFERWQCTQSGWSLLQATGATSSIKLSNISGMIGPALPICGPQQCGQESLQLWYDSCGGQANTKPDSWDDAHCTGDCLPCSQILSNPPASGCAEGDDSFFHCSETAHDPEGNPTILDVGWDCYNCPNRKDQWESANCSSGQEVTNYNCENNTGQCEDCVSKKNAWANANCPAGPGIEVTSYDCATDTGTCEDCYKKQRTWEYSYCQGPGLWTESYDCPSNTGVCKDCGLEKQTYENERCKPYGKILVAYDCAVHAGICSNDLCEEDRKAWKALHCSGPDQTMVSFDCDTKQGVCRDENDCQSKETAWDTQHCKPLGLTLKSYDCETDTGLCNDPYGCEERQELWESKYCQGPGLILKSYDCVSDIGVCENNSDCLIAESRWITSYCSADDDIFISFDCSTGHGQCKKGSDFNFNPTDEEKSKFTDRYDQFITEMRATPLFGLSDQVLGNIPSGGSPVYTVNMGQYGSSDVDLSRYDSIFAIIRTVFLVCFSFAALRILISHK